MQYNRRLDHIFRANGRALIVAMDHGLLDGPKRGLENAGETIQKVIEGKALKAYRDAYCHGIQDYHAQGKWAGNRAKWPLRFLIRHTAFHTLDHAWEMEDKDMTPKDA